MQFYVLNQQTQPDKYAIACVLSTTLLEVKMTSSLVIPLTDAKKVGETNVIELVDQNHLKVESFETVVNNASERFNSELETNMDPFAQQESDETYDQ